MKKIILNGYTQKDRKDFFTNIVHIEDQHKSFDMNRKNYLMLMSDIFVHVGKDLAYKQYTVAELDLKFC